MPNYIAFLRAINVGGHVVTMDRLKVLFQDLGFSDVATFIASGNVIFGSPIADAPALEEKIESHLLTSLGYKVATFIRTADEVAVLARYRPFAEADTKKTPTLVIGFLKNALAGSSKKLLVSMSSELDTLSTSGREIFWIGRNRQSESTFSNGVFEKRLSLQATFRGYATIVKLSRKYPGTAGTS
jgi:uncharacterized protein (DUF1697 family)